MKIIFTPTLGYGCRICDSPMLEIYSAEEGPKGTKLTLKSKETGRSMNEAAALVKQDVNCSILYCDLQNA